MTIFQWGVDYILREVVSFPHCHLVVELHYNLSERLKLWLSCGLPIYSLNFYHTQGY